MSGLLKEIWIAQIMEAYRQKTDWMEELEDMSAFVENNTINLSEAGVDPDVLINNVTYPVAFAERADTPFALPLDIFDTTGTVIRNAHLIELSYDKMASVTRGHVNSLRDKNAQRSAHAITPSANGANTPVYGTTGADNGSGFKLITENDLIDLSGKFDDLNIPEENRIMIMHSRHYNELVKTSATLRAQQAYAGSGVGNVARTVNNLFGFKIYRYTGVTLFNKTTGVKKAWGAAAAPATDTICSFAFSKNEAMRCTGDFEMFSRLNDPVEKGDIINFQQRFISLPKRNKFIGALYAAGV